MHPSGEIGELPKKTSSRCYDCITEPVNLGYGECSKCNCPGYVDQYGSELCGNCGHQYTDHF